MRQKYLKKKLEIRDRGNGKREDGFVGEPATIGSFHSSLKYASMHARAEWITNRGTVFPISHEPCLRRFTRGIESHRKFEENVRRWRRMEWSSCTDIVSNLVVTYRDRLNNPTSVLPITPALCGIAIVKKVRPLREIISRRDNFIRQNSRLHSNWFVTRNRKDTKPCPVVAKTYLII